MSKKDWKRGDPAILDTVELVEFHRWRPAHQGGKQFVEVWLRSGRLAVTRSRLLMEPDLLTKMAVAADRCRTWKDDQPHRVT